MLQNSRLYRMYQRYSEVYLLLFIAPGLLLVALSVVVVSSTAFAAEELRTTQLLFEEIEPGIEPYQVRYLIHGKRLRIDDGENSGGYLIYDDKAQAIYSVVHQNRMVLKVVATEALQKLPANIATPDVEIVALESSEAPKIAGFPVQIYQLRTENSVCAEYSAANGLFPEELKLLRAYQNVLAKNNRRNIDNQPADLIEPCMLLNDIVAADAFLREGFPIMHSKPVGWQRRLLNFATDVSVDATLFDIPASYKVFSP